jgi:hypothetical protein
MEGVAAAILLAMTNGPAAQVDIYEVASHLWETADDFAPTWTLRRPSTLRIPAPFAFSTRVGRAAWIGRAARDRMSNSGKRS